MLGDDEDDEDEPFSPPQPPTKAAPATKTTPKSKSAAAKKLATSPPDEETKQEESKTEAEETDKTSPPATQPPTILIVDDSSAASVDGDEPKEQPEQTAAVPQKRTPRAKAVAAVTVPTTAATEKKAKTPRRSAKQAANAATSETKKTGKSASASGKPVVIDVNATPSKEKTDEAAAVVVVQDPALAARIESYRSKIDELTRRCSKLLSASKDDADAEMDQEIYGIALDLELDAKQENDADIAQAFAAMKIHTSTADASASVDFSDAIKGFIAKHVQGKTDSLSALSKQVLACLQGTVSDAEQDNKSTTERILLQLEMEIKMLAQRTAYGNRPAKANLFEDTAADALWIWEIGNVDKYFEEESQKTIKRMRKHRKRVGQQLKTLARVVQLLHQTPVDEAKVSAEEAKVGKFVLLIESETQKAQDKERKEQEKRLAVEDKKRVEHERLQAKEDEKKKRALEVEAEKELASKRRKSMVSYFRSIASDEKAAADAAGDAPQLKAVGSVSSSQTAASDDGEVKIVSTQNEKLVRMDASIAYLFPEEPRSEEDSRPSTVRGLLSLQKPRMVTAREGRWSGKRRRDPKFGIMKFFQFHENYRPAFYGTWSKHSTIFRGGRRPLAQHSSLDYSVDSDEEWEEEEPGESLSAAESDEDSDEDNLDYGDQWLAYEDEVDYMDESDNEEAQDRKEDMLASPTKRKIPAQLEAKQRSRVAGGKKKSQLTKIAPRIEGPFWCHVQGECSEHFDGKYTVQLLQVPNFESTLMRKAKEQEERLEQERLRVKEQQEAKQAAAAAAFTSPTKPPVQPAASTASTKKSATEKKLASEKKATGEKKAKKKKTTGESSGTSAKTATPQKKARVAPHADKAPTASASTAPVASSTVAKKDITTWFKAQPSPVKAPPPSTAHDEEEEEEEKVAEL